LPNRASLTIPKVTSDYFVKFNMSSTPEKRKKERKKKKRKMEKSRVIQLWIAQLSIHTSSLGFIESGKLD